MRLQRELKGVPPKTYQSSELEQIVKRNFTNLCLTETQNFAIDVAGTTLILQVTSAQNTQISSGSRGIPFALFCIDKEASKSNRGLLIESTSVILTKASESTIKILGSVNTTYAILILRQISLFTELALLVLFYLDQTLTSNKWESEVLIKNLQTFLGVLLLREFSLPKLWRI